MVTGRENEFPAGRSLPVTLASLLSINCPTARCRHTCSPVREAGGYFNRIYVINSTFSGVRERVKVKPAYKSFLDSLRTACPGAHLKAHNILAVKLCTIYDAIKIKNRKNCHVQYESLYLFFYAGGQSERFYFH